MYTIRLANDLTILHLLQCLTLFLTPFYCVNACSPLLVTYEKKEITSLQQSINFLHLFIAVVVAFIMYL